MKHFAAEAPPVACVPAAIPADERGAHFQLILHLFENEVQEKTELPAGYKFRFPASSFDALSRFISNERRCCPFLTFELLVEPADAGIWLELTGPEGAREFLNAELCACWTGFR